MQIVERMNEIYQKTLPFMSAKVKKQILDDCRDDFVSIWSIIWEIEQAYQGTIQGSNQDEIQKIALDLVKELLDTNKIKGGYMESTGYFVPVSLSAPKIIERLVEELEAGDKLRTNDGLWFTKKS